MFINFEVGKKCDKLMGIYGMRASTSNLEAYIGIPDIKKEDERLFAQEDIEVSFKSTGPIVFMIVKVGDLILDAPMDLFRFPLQLPTISEIESCGNQGLPLILVIGDSRTGIIKQLRLLGLGHQFSIDVVRMFDRVKAEYRVKYDKLAFEMTLNAIYNRFSCDELYAIEGDESHSYIVKKQN